MGGFHAVAALSILAMLFCAALALTVLREAKVASH
jgi:hypothetical protein